MIDGESALQGLRHVAPEVVRLIRGSLDNGVTPAQLKRTCRGKVLVRFAGHVDAAIDYMAICPNAGAMRYLPNGQWNWEELELAREKGVYP